MQQVRDLMQQLQSLFGGFSVIATVLAFATSSLIAFWWLYLPPIRLVWNCLSNEDRFPLWDTLKACYATIWPPTPTSVKPTAFRNQMRLWLELRLLDPKPQNEPRWKPDFSAKCYQREDNDKEYRGKVKAWDDRIRSNFAPLKLGEKEPVIEVNNVFKLNADSAKNGIKQYLLAVSDLKLTPDNEVSFLCKVKVNDGFLLPLNLIAGMMSRFSDDWDPVISSYSDMAGKSVSPAQSSIFDLWLLWGPSVPICTCDQWAGPLSLQYGFGDESNSVRVLVRDPAKIKIVLDDLRKEAIRPERIAYPALHARIIGKLRPPSSFRFGEFSAAQHKSIDPNQEAFVLEYEHHEVRGHDRGSRLFYMTYVWAMFVVSRANKPTLDEVRNCPWLQVVPFFEHANIVDETSYTLAKLQLARKVLAYVESSTQFLWYACAIDDSGCGQKLEVKPEGRTIRQEIEQLLNEDEYEDLRNRIVLDDDSFAEVVSGCHICDVVENFFTEIAKQTGEH